MVRAGNSTASGVTAKSQQDAVSEGIDNFQLPRSLITKLARSGMSEDMKMQKDVVLAYQKASTVFINYLAAAAHEVAASKQHKSISASDVLRALEIVEMGDMVPAIQQELDVYRDIQKAEKNRKGSGAKGKAREIQPESISAATSAKAKAKGKEREKGPTITISRPQAVAAALPEPKTQQGSEPDAEPDEAELDEDQDDDEDDEEEMPAPDDEEEEEEEEDVEEEDVEDTMAVEDEELRRDARGLDNKNDQDE